MMDMGVVKLCGRKYTRNIIHTFTDQTICAVEHDGLGEVNRELLPVMRMRKERRLV